MVDLSRGLDILIPPLDVHGSKRKVAPVGERGGKRGKRGSAVSRYPGMSLSGGLSYPQAGGLNPGSLMGALGHMSHPMLMGAGAGGGDAAGGSSSGSSYLQNPGHALCDLQAMFPTAGTNFLGPATGNGHLPSSSSSTSAFSSTTTTMASLPPASSSSLPPYLLNPSMAGLLSGFPLTYSQSQPRMYPGSMHLPGAGMLSSATPSSTVSSYQAHYPGSPSSLLGAALSQPDSYPHDLAAAENGGSSSDDDVIEVTGQ